MAVMGCRSLAYTHAPEHSLHTANASLCSSSNGINSRLMESVLSSKSLKLRIPQRRKSLVLRLNVMAGKDYYSVLGVSRSSNKSEIKSAYRNLARQYHPDVNKDSRAEAKFKDISNAYEVLSDEEKRSIYDQYGEDGLKGFGSGGQPAYGSAFDLFEAFFEGMGDMDGMGNLGGMGFRSRSGKGPDEELELQIEFLEAVFGITKDIEVSRLDTCSTCKGSGNKPGTKPKKCSRCGGKGQLSSSIRTPLGDFRQVVPCNSCGGVGQSTTPCHECRGEGRVRKRKSVIVEVPAGVESGNRLRVRSEGSVNKRGAQRGDLIVSLYVKPHPHLTRDGNNILTSCKISYIDAIKGTSVKVPTVDGQAELRIPAGTQPGATLLIPRKGAMVLGEANRRGDQLVRVQVDIPRHLSHEERELIEKLSSLRVAQPLRAR